MRSVFSYWHFEPMVILFIVALCIIYLYAVHFRLTKQSLFFLRSCFDYCMCRFSFTFSW
jgi:hypothetical protein